MQNLTTFLDPFKTRAPFTEVFSKNMPFKESQIHHSTSTPTFQPIRLPATLLLSEHLRPGNLLLLNFTMRLSPFTLSGYMMLEWMLVHTSNLLTLTRINIRSLRS